MTFDETGWRIGGWPAWLHVWVGGQATCYAIDPHRSANALEQVIGLDWDGVLIHDGFASYDRFTTARHQQCVAHVLRRSRELLATARGGAVHFPHQLIGLFTTAVHAHHEYRQGRRTAADLVDLRMELEDRLAALLAPDRAVPAYETLARHLAEHFDAWFTFLDDPRVEATNWQAEQAIRPAVVKRCGAATGRRTEQRRKGFSPRCWRRANNRRYRPWISSARHYGRSATACCRGQSCWNPLNNDSKSNARPDHRCRWD